MRACAVLLLCALAAPAQEAFPVQVRVDARQTIGEMTPLWAWFGYDEPNYTTMKDGRKLLSQLAALSPAPVHVRTHNLLTSGDGTAALKWGSTNAYAEDAAGRPVYDWKILDGIFDVWIERGMTPLVEVGFMPEALSTKPEPYRHHFSLEPLNQSIEGGWAYPPKDWDKWAELIRQWVRHAVERYGRQEVETWWWEVWNEPNIGYWRGTPEEYQKLYTVTVKAIREALPTARVGGPHWAGGTSERSAGWFRGFLQATVGAAPMDFVAFHAKGAPRVVDGHVRMGIANQLNVIRTGFAVINEFPQLKDKPVVLGESDPEGCAACSAQVFPQNQYRNGTMYSSYTAASFARKYELADRAGLKLAGAVTWAFEFENQPWFDGFRDLATNGVEKPVLNVFRMYGLMRGERVRAESDGMIGLDDILKSGVREKPDVGVLASRGGNEAAVMLWHYHDDDVAGPDADVTLTLGGLPVSERKVLVEHFRIDNEHSNSYGAWKRMGSPQPPNPAQVATLERAARLEMLHAPEWVAAREGAVTLRFRLPRQGVSLVRAGW
jgi:xylan 1,4-beta-xylosidase